MKTYKRFLLIAFLLQTILPFSQILVTDSARFSGDFGNENWGFGGFSVDQNGNSYGAIDLYNAQFSHFYEDEYLDEWGDVCFYRFDRKGALTLKKVYGNGAFDYNAFHSVHNGPNNEIYITGFQQNDLMPDEINTGNYCNGSNFIARLDGDGEFIFAVAVTGNPHIAVRDNGNVYFVYTHQGNGYIGSNYVSSLFENEIIYGEIDSEGNLLWYEQSGIFPWLYNGMRGIRGAKADHDNLYFFGEFSGTTTFGAHAVNLSNSNGSGEEGYQDMYLAKLNMPTRTFENVVKTENIVVRDLDFDENGNLYLLNIHYVNGSLNLDGSFLGTDFPYNGREIYISKINPDWELIDTRTINTGTTNQSPSALAFENNNVFVTGKLYGFSQVYFENDIPYSLEQGFLAKYSDSLQYLSSVLFPCAYSRPNYLDVNEDEIFLCIPQGGETVFSVYKQSSNVIRGKIYKDFDMNHAFDSLDIPVSGNVISLVPEALKTVINSDGSYEIYLDSGTYQLVLHNIPSYYQIEPQDLSFSFDGTDDTLDLDIQLWPIPGGNDVSLNFFPLDPAVVGQMAKHKLLVTNEGSNLASGTVKLYPLAYGIPFNSSQIITSPQMQENVDFFSYDFADLPPGDTIAITIQYYIPADFLSLLNDSGNTSARVEISESDLDTNNNFSRFSAILLAGYDPNIKTVNQPGNIHVDSLNTFDKLEYTIHFQNEGNYYAQNIYIEDRMSHFLDLNSLEIIDYSDLVTVQIHGDKVKFIFNNIMLPWKSMDEEGSKGYVHYTIRKTDNLVVGDTIKNKAHIFFDYNPAIITNETFNIVISPPSTVSVSDFNGFSGGDLHIYPNPSEGQVNISFPIAFSGELNLFQSDGTLIHRAMYTNQKEIQTSLKDLGKGVYYLELRSNNNLIQQRKIVIY